MKKMLVIGSWLSVAAAGVFAVPSVSEVTVSQDAATRLVTVEYKISGGPAVVTAEFTTNNVALPDECVHRLAGDINVIVTNRTEKYSFTWNPDSDLQAEFGTTDQFNVRLTPWDANDPPPYLVVDLCTKGTWFFYASSNAVPDGVQHVRYKTDMVVMKKIPACNQTFRMGSFPGEKGSRDSNFGETDAEVPHPVTFTNDYYLGIYEVTQMQFRRLFGYASGQFSFLPDSRIHPVETVIYDTIRGPTSENIDWPSSGTNVTASSAIGCLRSTTGIASFDLPTEAEWEFACRAGTTTSLNSGKNLDYSNMWDNSSAEACPALSEVGWWLGNSLMVTNEALGATGRCTHPVGMKPCNAFGLYDMHGNVWEWCLDWYANGDYYSRGSYEISPVGPTTYETYAKRVVRGGSWSQYSPACRSAQRGRYNPSMYNSANQLGFRLKCLPFFGE